MTQPKEEVSVLLTFVRHGETLYNRSRTIQGQLDIPLSNEGLEQADKLGRFIKCNAQKTHGTQCFSFVPTPQLIVKSPLSRASETAIRVRKEAGWESIQMLDNDLVKEICFGQCEGFKYMDILKNLVSDSQIQNLLNVSTIDGFQKDPVTNWGKVGVFWKQNPSFKIPNMEDKEREYQPSSNIMETPDDLIDRAKDYIDYIGQTASQQNCEYFHVATFSHGFYLRVLLSEILSECNHAKIHIPVNLWNTSVSSVQVQLILNDGRYVVKSSRLLTINSVPHLY